LIKVVELLSVKYGLVYTNYDIFNHLTGITWSIALSRNATLNVSLSAFFFSRKSNLWYIV
jgi:hypothetical protein